MVLVKLHHGTATELPIARTETPFSRMQNAFIDGIYGFRLPSSNLYYSARLERPEAAFFFFTPIGRLCRDRLSRAIELSSTD